VSTALREEAQGAEAGAPRVASLARGMAILEQFNRHPELGGAEIARLTGLAQPTVWRLCYTMKCLGVLQDAANGRMRLGAGALALGFEALSDLPLTEAARPFMQEIADELDAAVTLALREGTAVIYVQRCLGGRMEFSGLRVGTSAPILSSPAGWGLVAGLPGAERDALLGQLAASGALSAAMRAALERAMGAYAAAGYVETHGLLHPNLRAVSAPLARPGQVLAWALSCGGHDATFHGEAVARAGARLRELAELLSLFVPDPS
jgi:DNA-binding IclR family transcriptional regulator